MGFRFRKSINLGGGLRINLSKSGVGYSWGTKGYRVTRSARGTTTRTVSIPGTGISYSHTNGKSRRKSGNATYNRQNHQIPSGNINSMPVESTNVYGTRVIENSVASEMVSDGLEDMLAEAGRILKLNKCFKIIFWITLISGLFLQWLWILSIIIAIFILIFKNKVKIDLDYVIEADQLPIIEENLKKYIKVAKSSDVWRVTQKNSVIDRKYTSGASTTINRISCKTSNAVPYPFKTNVDTISFKTINETLLFLPDKLLIIQGEKIGALSYADITATFKTTRFIENGHVPNDAKIVGHTWQYVNKSGGPDKRFKDNRQLPICLYGEVELKSLSGLNTVIMFSNPDINN